MDVSFEELLETGGVILSLPRYEHRFQYTRKRLEEVGFQNLQMFRGIDGFEDDLEAAAHAIGFKGVYHKEIIDRPGNIACTLSHVSAWKSIVEKNLPYLLIFEDDALPHPTFRQIAPAWWDATPRDLDIVLLGNQMDPEHPILQTPEHLVVAVPAYCLHAYIVTQKGARKLLHLVEQQAEMQMNDKQVMEWMATGLLQYGCWNGAWIHEKGYPTFTQNTPLEIAIESTDMIVEKRDTGIIYQNFCLGHTLSGKNQIYNIVVYT